MLTLEVYDNEVFAHYCPNDAGPNIGGCLGRIFPGGTFLNTTFKELQNIGNGTHNIVLKEFDERSGNGFTDEYHGNEHKESYLSDAGWAHFCHTVGAMTKLELQIHLDRMNAAGKKDFGRLDYTSSEEVTIESTSRYGTIDEKI